MFIKVLKKYLWFYNYLIFIVYIFACKLQPRIGTLFENNVLTKKLINPKMLCYEYLPYLLYVRCRRHLDLQTAGLFF